METRVFPEGTKTAEDAARAIGCPVSAIVKSLVFVLIGPDASEEPVVALIPGDLRLDTVKLADAAGVTGSRRATLDEARAATGYAAGGTPPFGHATSLRVFADTRLRRNDPVWAAAGTPTTVFPISISRPRPSRQAGLGGSERVTQCISPMGIVQIPLSV